VPWSIQTTLIIALAGLLFQLYGASRAVKAIASITGWPKTKLRIWAGVIILYLAVLPLSSLLGYTFGFSASFQASPLFEKLFVYPFWIGIAFGVQLFILLVFIAIAKLALYPLYKRNKTRSRAMEAWVVAAAVGLTAVFVTARVYSDTFLLRTRSAELRVNGLPAELDGLRIAHIADIQVDRRTNGSKLDRYVKTVNGLKPDLILFSGDTVTSGTAFVDQAAEVIGQLQSRYGTYACLGDHDYFANARLVVDRLRAQGVVVLENETATVPLDKGSIVITGVTNVYRNNLSDGVVDKLARERPEGTASILLTHQPSTWLVELAAERNYDLLVAGHTHGGQIVFPLPGFLLTGSSFETRYVTGFYDVKSMMVSINNGLGLTLAPIRYQAPAEVTLIVLRQG
jgi:predicted MPP superfamily phosphohydrolase